MPLWRGREPLLPTSAERDAGGAETGDAENEPNDAETPSVVPTPSPRETVRANMLAIEDGVSLMRRDAEHAASTGYTAGMRARLVACQVDIARRAELARESVIEAESRTSGGGRRQVEVAKMCTDLERVIQKFNTQNKLCVGA